MLSCGHSSRVENRSFVWKGKWLPGSIRTMEATKYVAFGVPDVDEAAAFYRDMLGFKEIRGPEGCVALTSGPLTLMICLDDGNSPCFNLSVDDI